MTAILGNLLRALRPANLSIILGYHRITDSEDFLPESLRTSTRVFKSQILFLRRHFDIVPLDQLLDRLRTKQRGHFAAITFDDGFKDVLHNAVPILLQFRLPATFFITRGFIESGTLTPLHEIYWYLRHHISEVYSVVQQRTALNGNSATLKDGIKISRDLVTERHRLERVLGFPFNSSKGQRLIDEVAAMARRRPDVMGPDLFLSKYDIASMAACADFTFGAHGVSHRALSGLPPAEQFSEIKGSLDFLKTDVGIRDKQLSTYFCYPHGNIEDHDPVTHQQIHAAGLNGAVVGEDLPLYSHYNPFAIPRLMLKDMPTWLFAYETLGIHRWLRRVRALANNS